MAGGAPAWHPGWQGYLMERKLPGARAQNELEIVDRERPIEFAVQTTSGPTPLVHRYRCDSEGATTVVHLAAEVELSGIAGAPVRSGRAW
jgi:hypothetical protein